MRQPTWSGTASRQGAQEARLGDDREQVGKVCAATPGAQRSASLQAEVQGWEVKCALSILRDPPVTWRGSS